MIFYRDIDLAHECWMYQRPKRISNNSLSKIDEYLSRQKLSDAHVVGEDDDSKFRSTKICWMCDDFEEIRSVYEEICLSVREINDNIWKYNLDGFESFQYGEYRSEEGGHYKWHIDTPARSNEDVRKITFVLGLNDDYEGGMFETMTFNTTSIKIKRGELIAIPSFILHRVTPVTKGIRKTLVGWGRGPNFI